MRRARHGRLRDAARLLAAADGLAEQLGSTWGPAHLTARSRAATRLRELLGDEHFDAQWKIGRALSFKDAIGSHSKSSDERAMRSLTSTNTPAHNDDRVDGQSEHRPAICAPGPHGRSMQLGQIDRADLRAG